MKRLLLYLPLSLLIVLSGCGGGGPAATRAHGRVVDQNGAGVSGVTVSLDDLYSDVTDGNGDYAFPSLAAGDYVLSAAGGDAGHYLAEPADVTIAAETDNNLGMTTAYRLIGIGTVIQSLVERGATPSQVNPAIKEIPLSGPVIGLRGQSERAFTRAASDEFLADNISFVYLEWAPINTADSYEIYYCAVTGDTKVWDSDDSHLEDPDYVDSAPKAFLDLTNELDGLIASAGIYDFKVVAVDGSGNPLLELPIVQVSLGWVLASYPGGLSGSGCFNGTTHVLSWTPVTETTDGYRVLVYAESGSTPLVDSGQDPLLSATEYDLSGAGLTETDYYQCRVDAQCLDATGWPVEITRGVGGFTY